MKHLQDGRNDTESVSSTHIKGDCQDRERRNEISKIDCVCILGGILMIHLPPAPATNVNLVKVYEEEISRTI